MDSSGRVVRALADCARQHCVSLQFHWLLLRKTEIFHGSSGWCMHGYFHQARLRPLKWCQLGDPNRHSHLDYPSPYSQSHRLDKLFRINLISIS